VLPFADLSETGDQAWLADGLTEEILNSLAALPDLRVTARTSSFQFKGENRDIGEIAKRLRVSYVVEGSVRRVGGRLRVTAQLVQARGGLHIWSNAYDATADDVLDVQRDVAEKIASALDIVLDENRREAMFRSGTRNVDAFEEFQRGWAIYQAVHNGEWDQTQWDANAHFERALNFDPGYTNAALAHADAFMHQLMSGSVGGVANSPYTPEEALVRLLADLDLAIENSSSPSMRLANELTRELYSDTWYRLPGLIEELRQEWDPSSISFEHAVWLRHILVFTGNDDLAREMAEEQLAIDPLGPEAWLARATVELHTGNFDLAREVVMQARRTLGDHVELERVAFRTAVLQGKKDEVIERLSARPGSENHPLLPAVRGDYETAARLADATDRKAQWPSLGLLNVYFEVGEADRAQDLVKRIDQSPAGSVRLLHHLAETGNALMFDLNHTPNFLAKMQQAGIDPAHFTPALRLSRLDTAVNE